MNPAGVIIFDQIADQEDSAAATVRSILLRSARFVDVLSRSAELGLPEWYLAAGCVAQTVWNFRTGRPLDAGIRDYDLIYFNPSDTSWDAENEIIRAAQARLADLPVIVEIRNQARVHLWYEQRFGKPCPPYDSAESAIDSFPATATSVGVRLEPTGHWRFYAPFGFNDLLNLVVRPNFALAPRNVYIEKSRRWIECWPELRVVPWDRPR
jgi:hypothetical protein